ncbi:MAG TPA: glycosyltransferase family 39 protein [Streptosporangiaceae bacterium]|nr:glycosyltransferase family 39 protein [Streptosporangiaceae bacterium]
MNEPIGSAAVRRPPQPAALVLTPAAPGPGGQLPVLVWVIVAVFVAVELAMSSRYGFLQDELYFIEAGRHLAFGYVDQPPIAPLLTRVTAVLGVSPAAIRIAPALAGAAVVIIAARFAALFGAGRFGRVLAALATACAPLVLALAHLGITEPFDLLAWAAVLLCVTVAVLRDRPRYWLGAGAAAGLGLEDNNLMVLLLICLAFGLLSPAGRPVLTTRWPWLGAGLAALIWAPNVGWQATHGWPEVAMAGALHRLDTTPADYLAGLPLQLLYAGLFAAPLVIVGLVHLWRTRELRFLAITATLLILYVTAWVPGKMYYSEGTAPVVLAAGAVAAERWMARGPRPRLRHGLLVAAPLLSIALSAWSELPIVPPAELHTIHSLDTVTTADTFGWPQFTRAVAAQDAALTRAGQRPTSIFTQDYGEAGALDVLGSRDHLPPVLSGHNTFWLWGPGRAADRVVLVVDDMAQLRPYFAHCRALTTFYVPDHVPSYITGLVIGVCTGPVAGWPALWPHLKHYG